jgi:hypothetical protein
MRAALDKAGPVNPASSEAPRRQAVTPVEAVPRSISAATRPLDTPTGSIAGAPLPGDSVSRSAPVELPSSAAAPTIENTVASSPAIQLAPPATVEIKSEPVASVDPNQPVPVAAEPPGRDRENPFTALTRHLHIDRLLSRNQPPRLPDQPPRPPLPVGE